MAQETFHYFAYGSNMLTRRLKAPERAPSAEFVDTGYIARRRLTFDKLSRDDSGKCDAEETGNESDRVYGVIFEISYKEKPDLDRVEGCGKGYELETVDVITKQRSLLQNSLGSGIYCREELLSLGNPWLARCRSLSRALFCRSILPPSHARLRILQKTQGKKISTKGVKVSSLLQNSSGSGIFYQER